MKNNCPFCNHKVLNGRILKRNSSFFIMLTNKPITKYHVLIISNEHKRDWSEFNNKMFRDLRDCIKWITKYIKDKTDKDVFYFLNAPSGQSILHYHLHAMPNLFISHQAENGLRETLK